MSLKNSSQDYKGREKIKIDVSYEDFISNPFAYLEKYLQITIDKHSKIVKEIDYLTKYYKGIQDIIDKVRADSSNINNISVMNYANEIVEFKKGFVVGKPIKYVNIQDETTEDMKYLNKYLKDVKKKSKDLNKYENLYIFGIAHTFVVPKKKEYDSEKKSPFDYEVLDSRNTFVVYSNDTYCTPLFSVYISNVIDEVTNQPKEVYTIYYNYHSMIVTFELSKLKIYRDVKLEPVENPITEYEKSQSRMGAFEPVLNALDNCNYIRSNQLDDIEQFINAFLIFLNQDPKYILANIQEFKKHRIFSLKTNNPQAPADIKLLQTSLNHGDINEMYNDIKQDIFNICGVPMATSSTGQGVSGEAQTYGGGWENAQAMATIETTYISQFEQIDLEKMIDICKNGKNSKLENIDANDIDIKYTINKSNNILTKMQAFRYWVDMGGIWERGLEITDLSDDSHTVGEESERHLQELQDRNIELEVKKKKLLNELNNNSDSENTTNENDYKNSEN